MKKLLILLVIISLSFSSLYSQQEQNNNRSWVMDFSPLCLVSHDYIEGTVLPETLVSMGFALLSVSVGFGYHVEIIPNILTPGFYIEGGMDYLSFFINAIIGDYYSTVAIFGFGGARIYNLFRFGILDIRPSYGITFFGYNGYGPLTSTYSLLVALGNYGLEYSYHRPLFEKDREKLNSVHRLSFLWHLR